MEGYCGKVFTLYLEVIWHYLKEDSGKLKVQIASPRANTHTHTHTHNRCS